MMPTGGWDNMYGHTVFRLQVNDLIEVLMQGETRNPFNSEMLVLIQ